MDNTDNSILVCGAGHQGISMAAHLALNGLNVNLWNRTYEHISLLSSKKVIECDGIFSGYGKLNKVSTNMSEVISDVIMVTTPSTGHRDIAKELAPYITPDTVVILNPGRTFGAIDFSLSLLQNGVKELPYVAETQTIVYTCRKKNDLSATIFAMKNGVKISSIKNRNIDYILSKLPDCLVNYFEKSNSILETSLNNVGMILHCAPVLMNIGWIESDKVDFKYYYDGISKSIASFLEKMDMERISVAKYLGVDIESVEGWLKRVYNVSGNSLYECIRNNPAYREIDAPPTINCRYIFEDIPNGLVPVEYIGKSLGFPTPTISTIIDLANSVCNIDFRVTGRKFGLDIINRFA